LRGDYVKSVKTLLRQTAVDAWSCAVFDAVKNLGRRRPEIHPQPLAESGGLAVSRKPRPRGVGGGFIRMDDSSRVWDGAEHPRFTLPRLSAAVCSLPDLCGCFLQAVALARHLTCLAGYDTPSRSAAMKSAKLPSVEGLFYLVEGEALMSNGLRYVGLPAQAETRALLPESEEEP
jgi:hypothetical protein